MYFVLILFWIIFFGHFTWEILFIGALVSLFIYVFLCRFCDYSPRTDLEVTKHIVGGLFYIINLIYEIIKANCSVIYYIFNSKLEVEPVLAHFKTDIKNHAFREILANSITLTPGTITVSLEENEYLVHCLDKDLAKDLDHSSFTEILEKGDDK